MQQKCTLTPESAMRVLPCAARFDGFKARRRAESRDHSSGSVQGTSALVLTALCLLSCCTTLQAAGQAKSSSSADLLSAEQAVQIAIANNRNLKIVSLSLDSSKEKLEVEKTRRLPSFSTYVFAS